MFLKPPPTPIEKKPFKCCICEFRAQTLVNLERHWAKKRDVKHNCKFKMPVCCSARSGYKLREQDNSWSPPKEESPPPIVTIHQKIKQRQLARKQPRVSNDDIPVGWDIQKILTEYESCFLKSSWIKNWNKKYTFYPLSRQKISRLKKQFPQHEDN